MIKEFGYEYDAVLNEKIWQKTKGKVTDKKLFGAFCLRSGRDALKAIAREFDPCTVFLPALACDSMIRPFELYGHNIKYYTLNSDYSICINDLELGKNRTMFLYMDYFGREAISETDLKRIKDSSGAILIEDRTHNLLSKRSNSFYPDYIIASLRKWVPIPDGGVLFGNISKPFSCDTLFSITRLRAQLMKNEYLKNGNESIKDDYRRIFSTVSALMDDDPPSAMSEYAYELILNTDMKKVKSIRESNSRVLTEILSTSKHIALIQDRSGISDLYVPFMVSNRDEVQRRLSLEGVFNTIIWPLREEQRTRCGVSKATSEGMLAAPCDQRYSTYDMKWIGNEIVRVIEDVNR